MRAVVMAGGFGTRLRPLTCNLPKPLVPVANQPILERNLQLLAKHGIQEVVMLLYYGGEEIRDYFGTGEKLGIKIHYVQQKGDFGTAGAVLTARKFLDETFLVISADILTDFNLLHLVLFHQRKKSQATLALYKVDDPAEFGIVITDQDGQIIRFLEKPRGGEIFSDNINTGIYILEPEVLHFMKPGKEYDFSQDIFPRILADQGRLYGCIMEGYWRDIGNVRDYLLANQDILSGKVKTHLTGESKTHAGDGHLFRGAGVKIAKTVEIFDNVIIGDGSRVEERAILVNSVIGCRCVIEAGAEIRDSVVWDEAQIGAGAKLKENIIGKAVAIGSVTTIGEGTVIGDNSTIGEGSRIKGNLKLWPGKSVAEGSVVSTSLIWADRWSRTIFGKYGVTGFGNREITPEFAAKLGAAYGASLGRGSQVVASRDSHRSCRMIHRALISGILSAGVNVLDLEQAPLPLARYDLKQMAAKGGFHVRKSPYEEPIIDMKFFGEGGLDLSTKEEKKIERLFHSEDFPRVSTEEVGEISFPYTRAVERYREGFFHYIKATQVSQAKFKVVIDYAYGSSANIFPAILGELGCEAISLNAYSDEKKLTKSLDEFKYSLGQMAHIVTSLQADLGVLMDAGGEKIFLVDEKGAIVDGDLALALVALLILKGHDKGTLAVPVTASRAIEEMAQSAGVKVIRTGISGRAIMETAQKEGVIFAGERTGGYIFPKFQPAFDAMLALAKILELLANLRLRLSDVAKFIPVTAMVKEIIPASFSSRGEIMRRLLEDVDGLPIQMIDGIKVFFDQDWVLVFPDPDLPSFHVQAEARDKEKAQKLLEKYSSKIKQWKREVKKA